MNQRTVLLPHLHDELVAAAARQIERQRRTRVALGGIAAAVVVLVAAAVAVVTATDRAGAGVEIAERDGRLRVRLTDLESRPDVVEEALEDAGLDVTVSALPVGPSNLGRFLGGASDVPTNLDLVGERGDTFAGFEIDVGTTERLDFVIGRPAEPGEDYGAASDAYAPGEPLSCLDVYGMTVAELAELPTIQALDVTIQPLVDGAPQGGSVPLGEAATGPIDAFRAIDALATAVDSVMVFATADGESPFPAPISPDRGACRE